jgi:hypothetical protein
MAVMAAVLAAISAASCGFGRTSLEPASGPVDAAVPVDRAHDLLADLPQDRAGRDAPDGAAGMDAPTPAPLCLSAAVSDPVAVLAEASAGELYLFRADGSRIDVGPAPGLIWRAGQFLVGVGHADATLHIMLVDRQGTVLWSYATTPDDPIDSGEVWVNDQGAATVRLAGEPSRRLGVAIAPDGTPTDLAKEPLGPPDSEGWIPVATALNACPCGFVKPGTAELLPASLDIARPAYAPSVAGDRLFYVGLDAGVPTVVMAEPGGAQTFPVPFVDPTATTVLALDEGALVLEQALPRGLLLPNPWSVREVGPLTGDGSSDTRVWTRGAYALVGVGNAPRWRLNLRTAEAWPIDPPLASKVPLEVTGTRALGGAFWRLDFSTGDVLSDDLTALAPLAPFASGCKQSAPMLLDDGRVAMAMVQGAEVGLYVGELGQAPWTRIGRPVSGVTSLTGQRFGETWLLASDSGKDTFCLPTGSTRVDAGDALVLGDAVQIVTPGGAEPVVFQGYRATEFVFQEAGLCAVERNAVYDFATGAKTALPPVDQDAVNGAQVFWW